MVIESDAPKLVENAAYTSYPGDPTAGVMAENAAYVSSSLIEPEEGNVVPATTENVAATRMKIVAATGI